MKTQAVPSEQIVSSDATVVLSGERILLCRDGTAYWPALDLLVVSDLHLEKGTAGARRRQFLPPYDTRQTLVRLAAAIARFEPRMVVSLGDSFHDGDGSDRLDGADRLHLASLAAGREWIWILGNHDPDPPKNLPGTAVREVAISGLTFRHEPMPGPGPGEVAGHLHPGARIVRRGRSVRRPCFAVDGDRLIMPAFGTYTGCLNVLDRAFDGLFRPGGLVAYVLGQERIYPIAGKFLVHG